MLARSQQRQTDLEDAAFTLEQQHKDVMTEIHHLYSASIAAHKGALEDRVEYLIEPVLNPSV